MLCMYVKYDSKQMGFSLIELSVVLVILGLLAGGVLSGQSLIRAAELRSVAQDAQKYTAAAYTFREKYFAIPGDMSNATQFWGFAGTTAAPNCLSTSGITAISSPGTCDGNGDGSTDLSTAAGQTSEIFQAWKQLALSGLIEGTYSGLSGPAGRFDAVSGMNTPKAKLNNALWYISTNKNYPGDANTYKYDLGNYFVIHSSGNGPILKPEEAWNIDTKLDDGKPAGGKIVAKYWNNLCSAADDGSSAVDDLVASYRLQDNTVQCALYFSNYF